MTTTSSIVLLQTGTTSLLFKILLLLISLQERSLTNAQAYCIDFKCYVSVVEHTPHDTELFNIDDHYGGLTILGTTFSDATKEDFITISESRKEVRVNGNFDREDMVDSNTAKENVTIIIEFVYVEMSDIKTISLFISVIDIDDNVPVFYIDNVATGDVYYKSTSESKTTKEILTLVARDFDEGINGTTDYSLGTESSTSFNITIESQNNGLPMIILKSIEELDREEKDYHVVYIIAREGNSNPDEAMITIYINITDLDDNPPSFGVTEYNKDVNEDANIGKLIVLVEAMDPDIGEHAEINYEITHLCAHSGSGSLCNPLNKPWPFAVNLTSGWLSLADTLDYGIAISYRVTVSATNPNNPDEGMASAIVRIAVLDLNNHPPFFSLFSPSKSINEAASSGSLAVFQIMDDDSDMYSQFYLQLLDKSTMTNSTTFRITDSGGENNFFSITLQGKLDREERDSYELEVIATDSLNTSLSSSRSFTVEVSDANDNEPVFVPVVNPQELNEHSPVNTEVIRFNVTDKDIGENAAIKFSLSPQSGSYPYQGMFAIGQTDGKLHVAAGNLDREMTPEVYVKVIAEDQNGEIINQKAPHSIEMVLNITLLDINDKKPEITTMILGSETVNEDQTKGYTILDIDATDDDIGSNAELTFSLKSMDTPLPVSINSKTGVITLNDTLDYETKQEYTFKVEVNDGVHTVESTNIRIIVHDVNDNDPYFPQLAYFKSIHENAPINSDIITVIAKDVDTSQYTNITYSFSDIYDHADFNLDPETGMITTAVALDWETRPHYSLQVIANDGHGRTSSINANVSITVTDINDEIPQFTNEPYIFTVKENSSGIVGQVTATSKEEGDHGSAVFSIINTDPVPFIIDPTSGNISTNGILDREDRETYVLEIKVDDLAPPENDNTTQVFVTVEDINDNSPLFLHDIYSIELSELQAVNSGFYTAIATDADIFPNNQTIYTLDQTETQFQIDPNTGVLSLTSSLNYEKQNNILLNITAGDKLEPEFVSSMKLNITVLDDNNTNITFPLDFPLQYHIEENVEIGKILLNFTAQDSKGNPQPNLNYYISYTGGEDSGDFGVDVYTRYALLTTAGELDRETQSSYNLNITITDHNNPPNFVTQFLTVYILDINDNYPEFPDAPYTFSFDEEQSGMQLIGKIKAVDNDFEENGTVTYSLKESSELFTIHSTTGALSQLQPLDRETQDEHTVVVIAMDDGSPAKSSTTTVTITVIDINDHSPEFSPNNITVKENIQSGTVVANIIGDDADTGDNGKVYFYRDETKESTGINHFLLYENGTMIVLMVPDYEAMNSFTYHVRVTDNGNPKRETFGTIIINVTDLNDNRPKFSETTEFFTIQVSELESIGYTIMTIEATDKDTGLAGVVRYGLESRADEKLVSIDSENGKLTLARQLDYERETIHVVTVLAYDLGRPRNWISQQNVTIEVLNEDDNNPAFDKLIYSFAVAENQNSGTEFGTLRAYDEDIGSLEDLKYKLSQIQPSGNNFEVTQANGKAKIETVGELNYEIQSIYILQLTVASLQKEAITNIQVFVENLNDEEPSFSRSQYSASVSELANIGTSVLFVSAKDDDNDTNNAVSFSIINGNDDNTFLVDASTGEIRLNGELDYEDRTSYTLVVMATDTGEPPLTATTSVVVTVVNENEHTPVFSKSQYLFSIQEESDNITTVGYVLAIDGDDGSYGNVAYSFQLPSNQFSIDSKTGQIETKFAIDREATPTIDDLIVIATDSVMSSTATVSITVSDINDNQPIFENPLYQFSIPFDLSPDVSIGKVTPMDKDLPQNSIATYSLANVTDNLFIVNATTGQLYLSTTLPQSYEHSYKFTLVAVDAGNDQLSSQTTVEVFTFTNTEHSPFFQQLWYNVNVTENSEVGAVLTTVIATDEDSDSLSYSFDNNYNKFSIGSNGIISLSQATLDYEQITDYTLKVYATDSSSRKGSSTVTITVLNVNDNPPNFVDPPTSLTLSPVSFHNVDLFKLEATDPDQSTFSFTLLSQTNRYAINTQTGVVSNLVSLTNGTVNNLNVRISDGTFNNDITVQVKVATPPANAPMFQGDTFNASVSEGETPGFIVHTFVAINPFEYNIVCCELATDVFKIDKTSGVLSTKSQLDYETQTEYDLVVEARNEIGNVIHSDYQLVHIGITNVNEYTPTFIGNADTTANENLSGEQLITQVMAEDDDSGEFGDITFSIVGGNTYSTFTIQPSGAIYLAAGKTLDTETVDTFELVVNARDGGDKQSSATVIVTVKNENDSPPEYSSNFTVGIYETAQKGDRVTQVVAHDPDSDSQLGYSLGIIKSYFDSTFIDGVTNLFKINSTTAVVTLNGELDREMIDLYIAEVIATDGASNTMTYLHINVLDVNDNIPKFGKSEYSVEMEELSPVGSVLLDSISATDDDSKAKSILTYSLLEGWPEGKFVIDELSGVIRVNSLVYFDGICTPPPDTFEGKVGVSDGHNTASTTVTVTIKDINNHLPVFNASPYDISVSDTAQVGDGIATFFISDEDCSLNGNFDTTFPDYYYYPYDLFSSHDFHNGTYEIRVKEPLVQGVYHFRIQAYNNYPYPAGYYLSGFGTFTVTVYPENFHTPLFQLRSYHFYVDEIANSGDVIGSVKASDSDIGEAGHITYSLIGYIVPFEVNENNGVITVSGELDYETKQEYIFEVTVTDNGFPMKYSTVNITVTVQDINDEPPVFTKSKYYANVQENVKNGTVLLNLGDSNVISDADSIASDGIRFNIESNNNVPFTINKTTGVMFTTGEIDYETNTTYQVFVTVYDYHLQNLSPVNATVVINVTGVNEYLPFFPSIDVNSFTVTLEYKPGDYIGTISASDYDNGDDGVLSFSFVTTPEPDFFTLLPNGSLYLNDNFAPATSVTGSRRKRNDDIVNVIAHVRATDNGLQPNSRETNISISIPSELISQDTVTETELPVTVIGGIGGAVALFIIILFILLIVGSILYKNSKKRRNKFVPKAENPHRSSTRASTPGTVASDVELRQYDTRNENRSSYIETEINLDEPNSESPDMRNTSRPSPRTRSTSDLASSVATDTLNLTQDAYYHYNKAQIDQIYATNIRLLNDHSQDSVHMFGSEGGGEAEGDDIDNVLFAKYDLELEPTDDMSYCKSRHSLISDTSDGPRDDYQFSQSTNPWSSRHSIIVDRASMNELGSDGSRPIVYHFEPSQPGPGMFTTSTQGSTVSLTRSLHNRNKYGSERDIRHNYPGGHNPHPAHMPAPMRYDYYHSDMPRPHHYESPILEYRGSSSVKSHEPPPPPYLSQDPYINPYYRHMEHQEGSRPQYEALLSTSSTSLSTNASHSRGRPFPRFH